VQRVGRWTRVKPGCEEEYRRWHREVWPELTDLVRKAGVRNYTIFMHGQDLFSYLEVDDWDEASRFITSQDVSKRWQKLLEPLMDAHDANMPWLQLEEVFHRD